MNKTAVSIAAILAVATVISFYIWSSHNRFYIMPSSQGFAYEVDRKTGRSWALIGANKIEQEMPDTKKRSERPFSDSEKVKITGNASLGYGSFSGKIYNGSELVVTRVVINVTAKEEDGSVRWNRDFSESVLIKPLETEAFSVVVAGDHGIEDAPWYIKEIYGYEK